MTETNRIVDQIRRGYDGDAWYGSSTTQILAGLTADEAAKRPVANAHRIWEIVLHLTAWKREVTKRLAGARAGLPEEGDWPEISDMSEPSWQTARRALDEAHRALLEAAGSVGDQRLDDPSNDTRDRAAGTGVSLYVLLQGIVQHDAYHAGQIALLRKAL